MNRCCFYRVLISTPFILFLLYYSRHKIMSTYQFAKTSLSQSDLHDINYIFSSYIEGRKLVIYGVKNCSDYSYPTLQNSSKQSLQPTIAKNVNPSCPWPISPACDFQTFILQFNIPQPEPSYSFGSSTISPQIIKADEKKHFLAVCVCPMFMYENWRQLVQFLELWSSLGATQFIFYINSVHPQVLHILQLYVQSGSVQLVNWSALPSEKAALNFYYLGQLLAINDCIFRSRNFAQFVAVVDLDEVLFPTNGESMVELLQFLVSDHPSASHFLFPNAYVYIPTNATNPVTLASNIDFSELKKSPRDTNAKPNAMKYIVKPEKITIAHIHSMLTHTGSTVTVPSARGVKLHLKPSNLVDWVVGPTFIDKNLTKLVEKAEASWKKRVRDLNIGKLALPASNGTLAREMEKCVDELYEDRSRCHTPLRCGNYSHFSWSRLSPENSWTKVYSNRN